MKDRVKLADGPRTLLRSALPGNKHWNGMSVDAEIKESPAGFGGARCCSRPSSCWVALEAGLKKQSMEELKSSRIKRALMLACDEPEYQRTPIHITNRNAR